MRASTWTILVVSAVIGFATILSAAEKVKTAPAKSAKTDAAAAEDSPSTEPAAAEAAAPATEADTSADTDTAEDTDTTEPVDSETDADGGVPEEEAAPPEPTPAPEITVEAPEVPEEPPPRLLYSKGDMETSLGLSLAGDGNANYLGFTAKFAYFVMDRLAPGLDLRYTGVVGESKTEYGYADSMTLLPLLKFVLARKQVAPYIFATGGYEWQWGAKSAANAWILGLGGGVNVSVSKHVLINIELSALHYWYTKKKIYWYNDKDPDLLSMKGSGNTKLRKSDCANGNCSEYSGDGSDLAEGDVVWVDTDSNQYLCASADSASCGLDKSFKDKSDKDREWFFPLISVGVVVTF